MIKDLLAVAMLVDNCTVWYVLHELCESWPHAEGRGAWEALFWALDWLVLKQNETVQHFTAYMTFLIYRGQTLLVLGSFSEVSIDLSGRELFLKS